MDQPARRRLRRGSRRASALIAIAACLVLGGPAMSLARFVDTDLSSGTIATDTLSPPTSLAGTATSTVSLTWTPTVDTYATGYLLYRGTATGGPYAPVGPVTPGSASSTTDAPGSGAFYYVLRSVYQSWTSVNSNEAAVTVGPPTTTTVRSCTTTAADTVAAGDNNGYQSNPSRVCTDDGSAATDSNSGSAHTNASCGTGATPATVKDRHRFWGYAFGLPGSVSSIAGITVRADLGMNNSGGTTNLCVQLSWDAGATWTSIKSVPVSGTAQSAYTFGSSSDTWGRTWAVGDFSTANFRVRVINASTQSNKQFQLDYAGVSVSYYP
jgi:hypothetical protein